MVKRQKLARSRAGGPATKPSWYRWWGIVVAIIIVVAGLVFWQLRGGNDQLSVAGNVLPTPIGFPESAQDVGTMEGELASTFTLKDETGQLVAVDPAEADQPIVLIFNMGLG